MLPTSIPSRYNSLVDDRQNHLPSQSQIDSIAGQIVKRRALILLLLLFVGLRWAVAQPAHASPQQQSDRVWDETEKARDLLAAGSIDAAISVLRQVICEQPENPDAHFLLGSALALVPRQTEAVAELKRAIELRPSFAPSHHTLGVALARFGQPQAAQEAFSRALELDPNFAEAHANLGLVLAQQTRLAEAREHLLLAIELRKGSEATAYWHYLVGKTHDDEGRVEEAALRYARATVLRPDYAEAYLALGMAQNLMMDRAAALESLQKAVSLSPRDARARYELGKQLLSLGQAEQAAEHLRHADQVLPNDRAILFALQRTLRRVGQTEESGEVRARLSELIRRDDRGRENVLMATELNNEAVELQKTGRLSAALEKYSKALELYPLHPGFRRNLGLLLCRLERWDEGVAELKEAARLDPEDEETTRALYIALDGAAAAKKTAGAGAKTP